MASHLDDVVVEYINGVVAEGCSSGVYMLEGSFRLQ